MTVGVTEPRTTVRGLDENRFREVLEFIASRAEYHDLTGEFPFDAFDALRRIGAQSLTVPEQFGGGGAGIAEAVEVIERVGAADPSVGLILQWNYTNHLTLQRPDNRGPTT